MNKMATAMQEGEYDSERPQNKVAVSRTLSSCSLWSRHQHFKF